MGAFQKRIGLDHHHKYQEKIMNCKFCKDENDTIRHLLLECNLIKTIWDNFENLLSINTIQNHKLNKDMILYHYFEDGQKTNIVKILGIIAAKC